METEEKIITQVQINQILSLVYNLNITAKDFDSLKQFFDNLPKK